MAGEKLCDFAAEALASVAICVVDGMQPSGAVGPTQVSRRNALLVLTVVSGGGFRRLRFEGNEAAVAIDGGRNIRAAEG